MDRVEVVIRTEKQFTDLGKYILQLIRGKKGPGLVHIFVAHTTCAIKIMEGEILLLSDVSKYLNIAFPQDGEYRHDMIGIRDVPVNERINGFAHMRQLFFDVSATVPVQDDQILLGKWQSVFLVEFDPIRDRKIIFTYYGEPQIS